MMTNYSLTLPISSLLLLGSCKRQEASPEGCPMQDALTTGIIEWDVSSYCFATPVANVSLPQFYVVNSAS
jgi:hypothetical protein